MIPFFTKLISFLSTILGLTGEYSEALGTHIIGLIKCLNTSPVIEANQKKRRRNYLKQKEE